MKPYQDVSLPVEERVNDLMSHMTVEQKVAQLQCLMFMGGEVENALKAFPNGLGTLTGFGGAPSIEGNADFSNKAQKAVIEKNDLGVPVLQHCEALTGMNAAGGTIFPSAIGLGATWNPDTIEKMTQIIRKQMVAVGIRHALSPVMDIARDPRWGRVGETYGEDPTLCAAMSVAFTKGLQGDNLKDGVVATSKHFLGYGFSDGGLNMASNPIPPRELRESFGKPFQAAITEANLESVMNSYGTIDGEMIIKSKHILTDLLRDEMGFKGTVVSDYMSINRAVGLKVSADAAAAGVEALKAGLDVELPMPYGFTQTLVDAVKEGRIEEFYVDRALRRILTTKFKLGLFENPYAREELIPEAYDPQKTKIHSLKAAREAIVLLKNEGILPLCKDIKKIAVIGPHGDSLRLLFGCYTYPALLEMAMGGSMTEMAGTMDGFAAADTTPKSPLFEGSRVRSEAAVVTETIKAIFSQKTPTILASIKAKCPNAEVVYEKGCDIAGTNRKGFDSAINAAKSADVVILTLGGKYGWGNNCTTGEGVDTDDIGLTGVQEELAKLIFETGTSCVMVHMDAKPLSSEFIAENFPSIIENWFPGDTGGEALADVLFGDYNPAGRLPITAARNSGQIPIYAMHRNGNSYRKMNTMILNDYVDGSKSPLFYFGEGKSYTTFAYSNLQLDKKIRADGTVHLSCDVMNSGDRDGEEVVQIYVRDELASMLRPNKELAGFARVALKAGETRKVHFYIRADQFAFLDVDMKWIVEAGEMSIQVGASSEDIRLEDKFEIENTTYIDGKNRGFFAKTKID
ncbi:MAG: glycoside hydrolase family 3 N-terminal domain-containing protein [Anaerolineaceae bacterium]